MQQVGRRKSLLPSATLLGLVVPLLRLTLIGQEERLERRKQRVCRQQHPRLERLDTEGVANASDTARQRSAGPGATAGA
jgi:hypothetical protein